MPNTLTPQRFAEKWAQTELKERASYQEHFIDLCRMVDHATPADLDPKGEFFTFEAGVKKIGGEQGYADVWYRGHFAIEYKGKDKYPTLEAAYQQLLQYRENLENPPLLIVCDIDRWEIHTNFTGTEKVVHAFTNGDIASSGRIQRMLRQIFDDPYQLHPGRTSADVTAAAADVFAVIAENMRRWKAEPARIGHFLTKLVFCLFAEDIGLLPTGPSGKGLFSEMASQTKTRPNDFARYAEQLFQAMAQGGMFSYQRVPLFDGRLFEDVHSEELSAEALLALERAGSLDWKAIEPSIFGQLFERSLDPDKRAQLGAHYTSRDDILLIVEPVLMEPLRREWEQVQADAEPIRECYDEALRSGTRAEQIACQQQLQALRDAMLDRLRSVKVLDPACGSGNFLYVALQLLKDLEKAVINSPLFVGLDPTLPQVHPRQLYGIEKDEIAHDLASIVVWIGYLQWLDSNGYARRMKQEPILEPLDNIKLMDAILAYDEGGNPVEPEWPAVDVIVSNPPFLGAKKMIGELGETYVEALRALYRGRLPGFTDLVAYWFERARTELSRGNVKRIGLLATNSIGMGTNLPVLKRVKETGDIFWAWSDREWILNGAAVRVAMIGFDNGSEAHRNLDGTVVQNINPDLTAYTDLTVAQKLAENSRIAFIGTQKTGPFDIPEAQARMLLAARNPSGRSNKEVLFPYFNAFDVTQRSRNVWVIDFGPYMSEEEAKLYELPYVHVCTYVLPRRENVRRKAHRERWWLHGDARPGMREAIDSLDRFIVTPAVSKYRLFAWLRESAHPDHALVVFARADDYFFGVLHSKLHEIWSLRMGTWLGVGNDPRYTPTTTFETFPFPWQPGEEPTADPVYIAISNAARQLHEERDAWLNPPGVDERKLKKRTLTNLYNELQQYRETEIPEVGSFAPRLAALHDALDRAVCDAYGWEHEVLDDEEEILRRLLALNLERAAGQEPPVEGGTLYDGFTDDD